ncbi:antitoxin [bacterium (Candidatus Gribaldobacteria) CG02_land_8_20_14_3_00_41_15]|uniref:Antitoxin n=1 Tax=bacterium (Candidatus Gribaldobacteria) CG02_land_8_20_14_3_00_41_15 TaxID=2014270 RepID=A0A2M7DDL6_9BACT|nr:MAG: antitoxin [bacterium (Candidatus Gribaldobacteria) CG02_land_8_20_14_3_00_41_15]
MPTEYQNRIAADPKIMVGKSIIKGTRITVELILRLLAEGMAEKEILENYPHLREEDIRAVLEYAFETVEREKVFPLNIQYAKRYA